MINGSSPTDQHLDHCVNKPEILSETQQALGSIFNNL